MNDDFIITPAASGQPRPARFIGAVAEPQGPAARRRAAWLGDGYRRPGHPDADALVRALARGDADAARDIIEAHGDGLRGLMGDDAQVALDAAARPAGRCRVSAPGGDLADDAPIAARAGIAYVRIRTGLIHLFAVGPCPAA